MAIEKVPLPIESGFALQAAHVAPNGDILAVIDNYGSSSLRWTAGSAPQTKIVRFNGANQLIWSTVINRVFERQLLEVGLGGQFVFAGQTSDLPLKTRGRDLTDQVIHTFSKDGRLLDQITLQGNGAERIEKIQISDAGIAWMTATSDSGIALGSSNYNVSAPIDPFGPGKPDNTLGQDVLVVRADVVSGGTRTYRVGTEFADASLGGKIVEADGSFLLRMSSPKTSTPRVNSVALDFEKPFSQGLGREYIVPLGGRVGAKAFYFSGAPTEAERYFASIDLGEAEFVDGVTGQRRLIGKKLVGLDAKSLAESNNSFYVDSVDSVQGKWLNSLAATSLDQLRDLDPFNTVPADRKILLYGTDFELADGGPRMISADSAGTIYLLGQLKKDQEAGAFSPFDGLTLLRATLGPSLNDAPGQPSFGMELAPGRDIKELLSAIPASLALRAGQPRDIAPADGATINVSAPGWSDTIQLIRISKADAAGSRLQTRQPESGFGTKVGSLIVGGDGNDVITGGFGWDIADGGAGNDLVKTGNGRDILTGGLGADELWGGFGWNTFRSEKDGSSDLLVIRSDQWLVNPRQNNTSGNNVDGSKTDVLEGLDGIDRIVIQGVSSGEISVRANASAHGLSGIGIYAKDVLEALVVDADLSASQLQAMVSGDNSAAAVNNTLASYGSGWLL